VALAQETVVRNSQLQSLVSRIPRQALGREAGDRLALTNCTQKSAVNNPFKQPAAINMEAID